MKYKPTPVQWAMLILFGLALLLLIPFGVIEIIGIIDPAIEDTFSEYWFDVQNPWLFWPFAIGSTVAGAILTWSGLHYIEGRIRRKDKPKD